MAQANGILSNFNFQNYNPFANRNQQQPPANQPGPQNQPAPNPAVNPAGNTNGNDPQNMQNPMAAYDNMWNPATEDQTTEPPAFSINPETMKKVTDGFDYSQGLPEELSQKMQSGEQPTWQDIIAMMNHTGRMTYANAMNHQSKLTEKYVGLHSQHFQKNLPKSFTQHSALQRIRSLPAAQGNPVVGQHMEKIATQLAEKYPNAPDEWVVEQTKNYYIQMAQALSPESFNTSPDGTPNAKNLPEKVDWDDFMKSDR